MPKLSELLKNQVTLPVPYRGTVISITYKPESVTSEQRAALQKRVADGEIKADELDAAMLADTLTRWDLTDDVDAPCELSFSTCKGLSTGLQMVLLNAIYDDQRNPQNPPKGN